MFTACLPGRRALDPIAEPFDNRLANRFDRKYSAALAYHRDRVGLAL
ncbi:hypothetical protein [Streptomyces sp. bgisy130]